MTNISMIGIKLPRILDHHKYIRPIEDIAWDIYRNPEYAYLRCSNRIFAKKNLQRFFNYETLSELEYMINDTKLLINISKP